MGEPPEGGTTHQENPGRCSACGRETEELPFIDWDTLDEDGKPFTNCEDCLGVLVGLMDAVTRLPEEGE